METYLQKYPAVGKRRITLVVVCLRFFVASLLGIVSSIPAEAGCVLAQRLTDSNSQAEFRARLARLEQATATDFNTVDDFYRNITKASFNVRHVEDIDPISLECVTCHDGANAPGVSPHVKIRPTRLKSFIRETGKDNDHPIGMRYTEYTFDRRNYVPMGAVSAEVTFIQGKVGCLSCHDMLNPARNHLVMSNENSKLCLSCHIK